MNRFFPSTARLGVAAMVATIGLFVVPFAPEAGAEEQPPPPRTVRVSGSATVKAAPDRASIAVSVVSRAATARAASEAGARTSKTVLETLRGAVEAPGEVKTAGYDLSPEYDYDTPRSAGQGPKLVGYVVTNRFSIVTDDLAGLGGLIDASVEAGANQIDSIGFFLDDEEAARRQALLQAGQKARSEAETVAQSLGVALGEVLDASTESNVAAPVAYGRKAMMMEAASAPPTEVVPGSLDIVASVSVTFAIR